MNRSSTTSFEHRLASAIEASPYTPSQLAVRIKVHRNSVRDWLSGNSRPGALSLAALAEALELDLNWLLLGRGHAPAPGNAEVVERLTSVAPDLQALLDSLHR